MNKIQEQKEKKNKEKSISISFYLTAINTNFIYL